MGDVLRACTAYAIIAGGGDGIAGTVLNFGGAPKWAQTVFDCLDGPSTWEQVVEALVSNKPSKTDAITMVFEREA